MTLRENPYASPKSDPGDGSIEAGRVEPVMPEGGDNAYLGPLFVCRKYVLLAVGGLTALSVLRLESWIVVLPWFPVLVELAIVLVALAFVGTLMAFYIFMFLAAHDHGGVVYGVGHVVVSMFLTPALLLGVFLIPVLVRGDVERAASNFPGLGPENAT